MLPDKIDFDWRKEYQCVNCKKLFNLRHAGTIILTIKNIRLIGKLNECVMVEKLADQNSSNIHQKLSTRICSLKCFLEYFKKLENKIKKKYKNPPIEDIMNLKDLDNYMDKRK